MPGSLMQWMPAASVSRPYPAALATFSWRYGAVACRTWSRVAAWALAAVAAASTTIAATASVRMMLLDMWFLLVTGSGAGRHRIGPHEHRVRHLDDFVHRQIGGRRVPADRLRAARLVDADGAEPAVRRLRQHVAADPADVVGHPLALGGRAGSRGLEISRAAPSVAAQDHIGVHQC